MPDAPTAIHEEEDQWAEEPLDELPLRPRRRLLAPLPLSLLGVLLLACGFIGGVLVEKGQTSSSSTGGAASGLVSRLTALRGAAGAGSTATGGGTGSGGAGSGSTGAGGGGFAGRLGLGGGATIGEVAYVSGNTLYVTDAEGNTVKVTTSPAASITKTVKADLHGIHPGETVVVRGTKGSGGAVSAESISVGAAGGGGLSSLFGGAGGRGAGGGAGASSGSGGPALFGG